MLIVALIFWLITMLIVLVSGIVVLQGEILAVIPFMIGIFYTLESFGWIKLELRDRKIKKRISEYIKHNSPGRAQ